MNLSELFFVLIIKLVFITIIWKLKIPRKSWCLKYNSWSFRPESYLRRTNTIFLVKSLSIGCDSNLPTILPGKCHGQRSLAGCSPWGCKESHTPEQRAEQSREREQDYSTFCTSAYLKSLYILIHLLLSTFLRGR